jgi:hypothetical protein
MRCGRGRELRPAGAGKLQVGLARASSVWGDTGDLRQGPARPSSTRAARGGSKQERRRRAPSRGRRGRAPPGASVRTLARGGAGDLHPGRQRRAPSRDVAGRARCGQGPIGRDAARGGDKMCNMSDIAGAKSENEKKRTYQHTSHPHFICRDSLQ